LRRAVAWMLGGGRTGTPPQGQGADVSGTSEATGMARRLVRDPVCGVHVAEVMSIPLREGGETLHFCSIACRDEYMRRTEKKIAANG
jgi:YHS domain-containing protein